MNVDRDRVSILKNGSRMGYLVEPHSDRCSRMCGMPVLSLGVVRSATLTANPQHIAVPQQQFACHHAHACNCHHETVSQHVSNYTVSNKVSQHVLLTYTGALFVSNVDYCCSVLVYISGHLLDRLHSVVNTAVYDWCSLQGILNTPLHSCAIFTG